MSEKRKKIGKEIVGIGKMGEYKVGGKFGELMSRSKRSVWMQSQGKYLYWWRTISGYGVRC